MKNYNIEYIIISASIVGQTMTVRSSTLRSNIKWWINTFQIIVFMLSIKLSRGKSKLNYSKHCRLQAGFHSFRWKIKNVGNFHNFVLIHKNMSWILNNYIALISLTPSPFFEFFLNEVFLYYDEVKLKQIVICVFRMI